MSQDQEFFAGRNTLTLTACTPHSEMGAAATAMISRVTGYLKRLSDATGYEVEVSVFGDEDGYPLDATVFLNGSVVMRNGRLGLASRFLGGLLEVY